MTTPLAWSTDIPLERVQAYEDGAGFCFLPTAALGSHGVEILPILQNLSIDVHQYNICFLNKLFPTPFIRHPFSCIHQSDVLIFKRHNLHSE